VVEVSTEYYGNFLNIILLVMLNVIDSWVRLQGFSILFLCFLKLQNLVGSLK
jgi:hypothetical protein